jgi:SAM-dependent methyltransferase
MLFERGQRTYALDASLDVPAIVASMTALPPGLRALDVGCGAGRTMEALVHAGIRVDGVDLSEAVLAQARTNPALGGCTFFVGRGNDCGDAPDGAYDLVYSYLCFRYIPSRTVRRELLRAMARALRPGGLLLVQLALHRTHTMDAIPAPHVAWSADHFDASEPNGKHDLWPTPDALPLVLADFSEVLRDVRLQIVDFPPERGLPSQLLVSGSASLGLAQRVYAQTTVPDAVQGRLFE